MAKSLMIFLGSVQACWSLIQLQETFAVALGGVPEFRRGAGVSSSLNSGTARTVITIFYFRAYYAVILESIDTPKDL